MFDNDPYQIKSARYYFIPNGKDGKDVFMPTDKVDVKNLAQPVICLEYQGPPLHGSNRFMIHLSDNGNPLTPPRSSHHICEHLEKNIKDFLTIAREYFDNYQSLDVKAFFERNKEAYEKILFNCQTKSF
jgi:hypothetical protein